MTRIVSAWSACSAGWMQEVSGLHRRPQRTQRPGAKRSARRRSAAERRRRRKRNSGRDRPLRFSASFCSLPDRGSSDPYDACIGDCVPRCPRRGHPTLCGFAVHLTILLAAWNAALRKEDSSRKTGTASGTRGCCPSGRQAVGHWAAPVSGAGSAAAEQRCDFRGRLLARVSFCAAGAAPSGNCADCRRAPASSGPLMAAGAGAAAQAATGCA